MMGFNFEKSFTHAQWMLFIFGLLYWLNSSSLASDKMLRRVVFQTFVLSDGATVQCYGTCGRDIEDPSGKALKFNVSRCEGKKLRFSCKTNYMVKVHLATLGQINPALEICQQKEQSSCVKDVADDVSRECEGQTRCNYDVTNTLLQKACGYVRYLYMDVRYLCIPRPTTVPTTRLTTYARPFSTGKRDPKTTHTPRGRPYTTRMHPSVAMVTNSPTTKKTLVVVVKPSSNKGGGMFWLMTAYSWLTDKEFIEANGTHLALAIILSIFIGLVLSLCFMLDHCRRERMKRARKALLDHSNNNDLLSMEDGHAESMELNGLGHPGFTHVNGYVPKIDSDSISDKDHIDSEKYPLLVVGVDGQRNHSEGVVSYLPPPPRELLESPDDRPDNIIPPPFGFENNADASLQKGKLPAVPSFIITSPTPTCSSSAVVSNAVKSVSTVSGAITSGTATTTGILRNDPEKAQKERSYANRPGACSEKLPRKFPQNEKIPYKSMPRKHSQNDFFNPMSQNSPPLQRRRSSMDRMEEILSYQQYKRDLASTDHPDNANRSDFPSPAVTPTKFAMSGRISPTDPRQQPGHDIMEQSDILPDAEAVSRWRPNITGSMQNLSTLSRLPRKGRLHVIAPSSITSQHVPPLKEKFRSKTPGPGFSSKSAAQSFDMHMSSRAAANRHDFASNIGGNSKIFTVPKHKCGSGHNHACICIPVRTANGSFTCACLEKMKSGYKDCCMTACDTSQVIQKEPYSTQRACTPAVSERAASALARPITHCGTSVDCSNERKIKDTKETSGSTNSTDSRSAGVEESGYHSHGTGTDSLCSSARSTDQEDSQMFQPTSQHDIRPSNMRNSRLKTLRSREKSGKKDPKLVAVTVHPRSSNRSGRRSRYESKLPVDIRPSESSLDDDSLKDSVKIVVRTKTRSRKKEDSIDSKHYSEDNDEFKSVPLKQTRSDSQGRSTSKKECRIQAVGFGDDPLTQTL